LSRVFRIGALFACILSTPAAAEQPVPGAYKALGGAGVVACGAFVNELEKGLQGDLTLGLTVTSWVEGYITAYNATLSGSADVKGDLARDMSAQQVMEWVVDFCAEHPNDPIAAAAGQAVMHLFQLATSRAGAE
jgi:hypothetical protein